MVLDISIIIAPVTTQRHYTGQLVVIIGELSVSYNGGTNCSPFYKDGIVLDSYLSQEDIFPMIIYCKIANQIATEMTNYVCIGSFFFKATPVYGAESSMQQSADRSLCARIKGGLLTRKRFMGR